MSYVYKVEEQSVDVRHYTVKSSVKLTKDEVMSVYGESCQVEGTNLVDEVEWSGTPEADGRREFEFEVGQVVTATFDGTEYGQDCGRYIQSDDLLDYMRHPDMMKVK